jgi:hypothetical protein
VQQDAEVNPLIVELPGEVAGLLRRPLSIRFGRARRRQDTSRAKVNEGQDVQSLEEDSVDAKEIRRDESLSVV